MTDSKPSITVTILFFAALREQAGLEQQTLTTTATTPALLYEQLRKTHSLTYTVDNLRVAINESFVDWQSPLQSGDTVAFLAPLAGG